MSQESSNCHEMLGVAEGASAQELKTAYRDLAKVWHPDRFAHDPRLQQKAQEKLKEINEAYEQLTSGKSSFKKRTTERRATEKRTPGEAQTLTPERSPRASGKLVLLPICVFTVVLLVSGFLLIRWREPSPPNPTPEAESRHAEQTFAADGASETVREQQRAGKKPVAKQLPAEATKEPTVERAAAATLKPVPTVTLTIDPASGLIATTHCPAKSRMTYADGTEPRQHCPLHQTGASVAADPPQKESRLKSLTGRLASPSKWFRGKEKSGSAQRETPASQNAVHPN